MIKEGKYVTYDLKPDRNDPTAVGTRRDGPGDLCEAAMIEQTIGFDALPRASYDERRAVRSFKMNVSLPSEFASFVDELVTTGDISHRRGRGVRALRRLKEDQANCESLQASFDEALAELERTGGTPLDFDEIKRKARALAARRN